MGTLIDLGLPVPHGNWWERAACQDSDVELFFPDRGSDSGQRARQVCSGCPVADECLAAALLEERHAATGHRHGIRGGFSGPERAILSA